MGQARVTGLPTDTDTDTDTDTHAHAGASYPRPCTQRWGRIQPPRWLAGTLARPDSETSMAIPVASRWWIVTLLIVGTLLLISALALDRPNVVWQSHKPHCPLCRNEVREFSSRCGECRGEFDWVVAGEEESPVSHNSLSVLESEWLHDRLQELTVEEAAKRVAEFTGLSAEASAEYVKSVGRGDCGWCGGTKRNLDAEPPEPPEACPCCFGSGDSVACGGNRRVRMGDPTARRALHAYKTELDDLLRSEASGERRAREAQRLAEEFLSVHAGTQEASRIAYWVDIAEGGSQARTVTQAARERLDLVLKALRAEP